MADIKIDKLIRSRRKTIGLHITSDAKLIVRAPFFTSNSFIQNLVQRKESWIRSKQDFYKQRQKMVRKFEAGEEFLFLGVRYPLVVAEDLPKAVIFDGCLKISRFVLANARDHLECWYSLQALDYITARVRHWASKDAGLMTYKSIRINNAATRWGSCGYNNSLNFTWRLIMAPPNVVDYVVVHELAHLRQKNHSHKFWAEVSLMMPDYRKEEAWLRENHHLLIWP